MRCTNCGLEFSEGIFCPECGTKYVEKEISNTYNFDGVVQEKQEVEKYGMYNNKKVVEENLEEKRQKKINFMATRSLLLGIVCWIGILTVIVPMVCSIWSIVDGIRALKNRTKNKVRAIIGLFLSISVMCFIIYAVTLPPSENSTQASVVTEKKKSISDKDNISKSRLSYTDAAELFNKEYDKFITDSCDEVGDLFDYWNNNDFSTLEDIKAYEQMWESVSNDTRDIQNKLMENRPPEEYEKTWDDIVERMGEIVDILAKGKNFDSNHDGSYTGDEMKELLQEIQDEFVSVTKEVVELANELESISEKVDISNKKNSAHICSICRKEAFLVSISPITGKAEYYCEQHYSEIINTKNEQKKDTQEKKEDKISKNKETTSSINYSTSEENYNNLSYKEVTDDDVLGEVWAMAQSFVKDKLKSPTSAKFPTYGNDNVSIENSGNYYRVIGYVDAENSFGAEIRSTFFLILKKNGNKYTLKESYIY